MSKGALMGPRRLTLQVPHYQGDYATGVFPDSNEWTNSGLPNALIWEGNFETQGVISLM
jgi:hypothetical protein